MKIAFIGYGNVGGPLAIHLQKLGHDVTLASNDPVSESVAKVISRNPNINVSSPKTAVSEAEIVFLATPYGANEAALTNVKEELSGKIIVDCTNPVGAGVSHGLNSEISGSEVIKNLIPAADVVKAFTIYGYENFEDNSYPDYNVKPVMMFCGSSESAKGKVKELIEKLGWDALDVGGLNQALHLEHMTLMWVKMVRINGHNPNMVWGHLKR
ncbi:NADPH-dependent F420 reductase [Shewanella zhangzhouensis]|uniref:NADPH-dependent F420 reductase n=1 Tax=Shewanella zhangzhouensis TaxID=2864213 RepID=UPI001C654F4E|nr:NADPH-dependent F420 reductase [Shewanella zhangzhouensis]QYK07022.1 NADPH-dependent F420 reductase [Shewanella zhangzhouensis]